MSVYDDSVSEPQREAIRRKQCDRRAAEVAGALQLVKQLSARSATPLAAPISVAGGASIDTAAAPVPTAHPAAAAASASVSAHGMLRVAVTPATASAEGAQVGTDVGRHLCHSPPT